MSLSIESTFWLASATPERALALASVTSVRTFPLASARAERATRANVAITTEHQGTSVESAALFNTTPARAHAHSGPPSTGITVAMDGGVADTTRANPTVLTQAVKIGGAWGKKDTTSLERRC